MPYLNQPEGAWQDEPMQCRILSAGLELFVKNGYHNVSVHDVQKHANVSIGSIYNHFGGKEGVAKGLYEHLLKELEHMVEEVIGSQTDPRSCCEEIIRRLMTHTETHRNIMAFVFNARHREFLSAEPPICSSIPFALMRSVVEQGMDEGQIRQTSPWVAASAVFGTAIRMIQLRIDGLIDQPLTGFIDEVIETTWSGMEGMQNQQLKTAV